MRTIYLLFATLFSTLVAGSTAAQGLVFSDSLHTVTGISEDDAPRTYRFRYQNHSKQPVVILRVETTCGCTQPSFSRKPILPGSQGEVSVVFHPLGRAGTLHKIVTVYTNLSGNKPAAQLVLSGHVAQTTDKYISYPVHMGPLRLRHAQVNFRPTMAPDKRIERIEVINAGKKPLRLKAFGFAPYVEFETQPAVIAPDSVADLVFTLRTDRTNLRGTFKTEILLDNLGQPLVPSKRAIGIKGEIR